MHKRSLIIYDLVGTALVCGAAALGVWSGFFHLHTSVARLAQARDRLAATAATLADAEAALRMEQARGTQLKADISQRGALPRQSPVEDDLRDVARLARESNMDLVQVTPLAGEKYPGLVELRYNVLTRGDFAELLHFLRAFEQSTLWADITGVDIGAPQQGEDGQQRTSIVLSLFAMQEAEAVASR
ncbi:MAG TPA: hypothetical protein P5572_02200 [Phycisphaerae bacterium]|nr:hypothetical protein [Phycisphaerales bacterium]HRX83813.1 hypothetical protein [Phycisphaerae bacterium]